MPETADTLATDPGAAATAQDQLNSAKANLADVVQDNQQALAAAEAAISGAQAAGASAVAQAQAVVIAAQANLNDVVAHNQQAVAGAQLAVTQAE